MHEAGACRVCMHECMRDFLRSGACVEFDCMCVKLCMCEVEGRTLLLK